MKLQGCTLADTWLHNLTGIGYNIMSIPPIMRNHDIHGFWSVSDAVYDIYDVSMALEFNNISIFQILLLKSNIQFFNVFASKQLPFLPTRTPEECVGCETWCSSSLVASTVRSLHNHSGKTFRVRVSGTGSFPQWKGTEIQQVPDDYEQARHRALESVT